MILVSLLIYGTYHIIATISNEVLREEGWDNGDNYNKVNEILRQVEEELLNQNVSTGSNINDRYEIIFFLCFVFCRQSIDNFSFFIFLLAVVQEIC